MSDGTWSYDLGPAALTPQQEIRARSVDNAAALVGDAVRLGMITMVEPGNVAAGVADLVTEMAGHLAQWIEHGDLPESGHVS